MSRPRTAGKVAPSARAVALDLLQAVLERHRPLDEALEHHDSLAALTTRDRAFARLLLATTLRRLGQVDRILDLCLERPLPQRADAVRHLLRFGIAQLLFLNTPAHAAIDTTVALVAGRGGEEGYKGLVNAVLRRVDRERDALLGQASDPALNVPPWLWQSWREAYGIETTAAVAAAHLRGPPLDLSVKEDAAGWADRLGARLLPTGTLRLAAEGAIDTLPGYADGAWWVQDAAAALPARLLGDVAGKRIIDLCAAPGGKAAQLAVAGAQVTAVDRSAARLRRLAENLARLQLAATTVAADATEWRPDTAADAVLLDAPCSATGTIRRHPDVPWLKRPQDVAKLAALQDRLLRAGVAMTRPGGLIVYCTCSLEPAEGPARIAALVESGEPVERVRIRAEAVGGLRELLTPAGELRTLPCHLAELGGLDGFYAACLRRL